MKISTEQLLAAERAASSAKPQPLPKPEGDRRTQAALDRDRVFRRGVLAMGAVAVAAGSGFGRFAAVHGLWPTALGCILAGGLFARWAGPSGAWRRGTADVAAARAGSWWFAAIAIVFAALCGLRSGTAGALTVVAVAGIASIAAVLNSLGRAASLVGSLLLVTAAAGISWALEAGMGGPWTGSVILTLAALSSVVSSLSVDASVNIVLATTRFAPMAYFWFALAADGRASWTVLALAVAATVTLEVLSTGRRSMFTLIAMVAGVHLGALCLSADLVGRELPLQLVAIAAEFALLVLCGLRHVQASWWRLPSATYRVAPLCIVPRLDRAWDHPVKINVS